MSAKPHISVKDLNVWYGSQKILNNISVDIPDKKITAILGPSGCGKTTLLKSLNRLIELQDGVRIDGNVLVDGENILDAKRDVTHLRKRIGLMLQKPQVLPMSIYDNVAYGPRIHGTASKKELDTLVERHLVQAHLWTEVKDRLGAPASRLSIGQQQRLCLARTLAIEPEVILGDEATSALDPVSAQQIEQLFLELKDQYTIVLVTHNLRQAKRLADHIIFLYLGDLIEVAPAAEFFNKPKYAKTRAYIEGKFIEDFKISREVSLTGAGGVDHSRETRGLLEGMEIGQILKVVVHNESAVKKISAEVELEGHNVLEVKRRTRDDWEIVIEKQNVNYAI